MVNNAVIVEKLGIQWNTPATQFFDESRLDPNRGKKQRANKSINKNGLNKNNLPQNTKGLRRATTLPPQSRQHWYKKETNGAFFFFFKLISRQQCQHYQILVTHTKVSRMAHCNYDSVARVVSGNDRIGKTRKRENVLQLLPRREKHHW